MERLLDYFKPERYNLTLDINKHKKELKGHLEILGKAKGNTIKLHSDGNEIDVVLAESGKKLEYTTENGLLTILNAPEGEQKIIIDYHRTLKKALEGVYLSSFSDGKKTEYLVTTQFESHYARRCFPCVDEPAAKAVFSLTIKTPNDGDVVLSNAPVKNIEEIDDQKITSFEDTPKMSTYLVAFIIGPFVKKSLTSTSGVKITSYCTPNHNMNLLDYPTEVGAKSLEYYNELFKIPYPLKKLDMVAIPDFEAGAMENWGLITYRESCFLADENSALDTRKSAALTISHEISHQWFGDLVTMKWWDDLWLNESFATIMEYLSIDHIYPEYNIMEDFFTTDCVSAFRRDALSGVQSIKQSVNDPAEIATLFDSSIVYAKGAHLVLMLMRLMGEDKFFAGIKSYLEAHAYKNAQADDLWASLQPFAKFNVKEFMDAWISQPGYPVITDGSQHRFLLNSADDSSVWPLPDVKDDMSGHYIINLSGPEFADALDNFANLSLEQRIRLLVDRELLAKTPLVSSASLVDLLPKFKEESSASLWELLSYITGDLKLFFKPESSEEAEYKAFLRDIITPNLKKINLVPDKYDKDNTIRLRNAIFGAALFSEEQEFTANMANLYSDDISSLNSEIRFFILSAKLRQDESIIDHYIKAYQENSDPEIKYDLLSVMARVKTESAIKKVFDLLNKPEIVKPQDLLYLYIYLRRNYKTKQQVLSWLFNNWDYVSKIAGDKSLEDYPRYTASTIQDQAEFDIFFDFFKKYENDPLLARTLSVAKTEISSKIELIQDDSTAVQQKIKNYLKNL